MALINRKTDLSYMCKYQVPSLVFMLGNDTIIMNPTNILSIEKVDDYEFNLRSILKVSINVDIRKKLWLIKNKNDIVCKFELDMFGLSQDGETELVDPANIFNARFGIYFNDNDDSTDTDTLETTLDNYSGTDISSVNTSEDGYFTSDNILDVYLFDKDLTNASNKTYNKVYTRANVQQMIAQLLTETNHKRVVMSPIENNEIYYEKFVPANKAYKGLIWIDEWYGLYKRGSIIYYDTDILYIINPNGRSTVKQEDEWEETTFLVTSRSNSTPGNGMVRKPKEKKYYINIPEENVNTQKLSTNMNTKYGSAAKIVVAKSTTIDTVEADQTYMNQRNETITYVSKSNGKYTASMTKARMEENEVILFITADNIDIRAFTPNKVYKIIFEETAKQEKYGKYHYRIAYAYHYIAAESGEYMQSSHQIIMKRCSTT